MSKDKIQLSKKQQEIVSFTKGALLIIAGAGSGKTRVLTERIKALTKVTKRQILAITFTNAASEEIKERIQEDVDISESIFIGTFHSFCISVIENHGSLIGFDEVPQIFSNTDDRMKVLEVAINSTPSVKQVYLESAEKERKKILYNSLDFFAKIKRDVILDEDLEVKGINDNTILLYRTYCDLMKSLNAIDFDDLLLLVYKLFISQPKIASLYRRNYEFICIDESQDMNKAQYMLLRALTGDDHNNIMFVGDPNQSIFAFNGSSPKYMTKWFVEDYKPHTIILDENYRSSKKVLELANKIIPNSSPLEKVVLEGVYEIHPFDNTDEESIWVVNKINELIALNIVKDVELPILENNFTILARNKYVLGRVEVELKNENINYYYKTASSEVVFDSDLMKIFMLAIQVKINPSDRLHLSQLQKFLNISGKKTLAEVSQTDIVNYYKDVVNAVLTLNNDGSNINRQMKTLKGKFEDATNFSELNTNERLLFISDCNVLLEHWQRYNSTTSNTSLSSFKNAMSLGKTTKTFDQNGVALSTVHTMKGQENDIVFLIGMDNETFPDYRAINKGGVEMEQERNNLYVAITRAKRHLYISYPLNRTMPWGGIKTRVISTFLK